MEGKHFILDFETLGSDVLRAFPILECSYAVFDADRFLNEPYTFEELIGGVVLRDKINIEHQVKEFGYKIDNNVLNWWKEQDSKIVSEILKPSAKDLHVGDFIENIIQLLEKHKPYYWWSRSNTFDPIILLRIADSVGRRYEIETLLKYWTVRDTRTYIDAKLNFAQKMNSFIPESNERKWNEKFQKHNSVHDVAADILRLQKIVILENTD